MPKYPFPIETSVDANTWLFTDISGIRKEIAASDEKGLKRIWDNPSPVPREEKSRLSSQSTKLFFKLVYWQLQTFN